MPLLTGLILYKVVFIANMALVPSFWTIYGLIATLFLISRLPYAYLHKDDHTAVYSASEYPNVSVVIACKNEEGGIFKTISTAMASEYQGIIECIVIDDGSTDGTLAEMHRARDTYGAEHVKVISFPKNLGKREAMAVGINEAKYEIVTFIDSDSFVAVDGIRHLAEHFMANPKVGAVAGNTKVENINATCSPRCSPSSTPSRSTSTRRARACTNQ
ncbi:MAG: glycosyltransferase family 2 protein [bacterium]